MAPATWTASPRHYRTAGAYVPALAGEIRDWLAARPGERVLDLGCGDGTIAAQLVSAGIDVLAVDADAAMVRATRRRGVPALVADAATLADVDGPFDAVLSNAVLHWVDDHVAVARAVRRVLRPGGRLAVELGGHGNVAAVRVALRAALDAAGHHAVALPGWRFPTPAAFAADLADGGLVVDRIELSPRPTPVPAGLTGWLELFAAPVAHAVGDAWADVRRHAARLAELALRQPDGTWTLDYVRLRALAHRPEA